MGKMGLPYVKHHPLFRLILYITNIYKILQEDNIKMAVKETNGRVWSQYHGSDSSGFS